MSAAKILWQNEVDQVLDAFCNDEIDKNEATDRLRQLGFDPDEIEDELWAAKE